MSEPILTRRDGVQQITFRAMGSEILAAVEADTPQAAARLAAVPEWFAAWEQSLSRFRPTSELSRLNAGAGDGGPQPVSTTLWEVLHLALQAARSTAGLVTPTILPALEAAGYTASFETLPVATPGAASAPARTPARHSRRVPAWRRIRLDPATRSVQLPAGVRLDLGGIAKGWAADEAVARLAADGPALVNAGGDIAVRGRRTAGAGWLIGVDGPVGPDGPPDAPLALLAVAAGGVATSGRDYRRWQQGGTWQHHLIDPRTSRPATTNVLTATVVGPSAAVAEIAAKTVLLLGRHAGLVWLEARPALAGLLVLESGEVVYSGRFGDYLWSETDGPASGLAGAD